MLVLAFIAGLVGGVLADRLLVGNPAFAQPADGNFAVVTARQFRLVDNNGTERATLCMLQDGSAELIFADKEGKKRLVAGTFAEQNPNIVFCHSDGSIRAIYTVQPGGEPAVLLAHKNQATGILMGIINDRAGLQFQDAAGKVTGRIP